MPENWLNCKLTRTDSYRHDASYAYRGNIWLSTERVGTPGE